MKKNNRLTLAKSIPWLLVIGGVIGMICSFIITEDKFKLAANHNFIPSCNLNPIIACGNVMSSAQGSVFGFPNSFIGLATFAALATIGVGIIAGARYKRWFWLGLEGGVLLGLVFAYWLLFESVYRIHALCPYCLTVDVVVIALSWYLTLYNVDSGNIKLSGKVNKYYGFARSHHLDIYVLWLLVTTALILKHFWYYYGHYL
jgi:uncharacterized membrane protein